MADRDKLLALRKAKAEKAEQKHKDLIASNASIKEAILELGKTIDPSMGVDLIIQEVNKLGEMLTFKDEVKRIEDALRSKLNVNGIDDLSNKIDGLNNDDVVSAIDALAVKMEREALSQEAKDFMPVRRVRKVGTAFVFDDSPQQVSIAGGGASVQQQLIRNGDSISVVNPDGTPIAGGSGGGGDASAANQDEQTAVLEEIRDNTQSIEVSVGDVDVNTDELEAKVDVTNTKLDTIASQQQQNALTDAELRASPIDVDTGLVVQTDALTDTELRASSVGTTDDDKDTLLAYAEILTADDTITPSPGMRIKVMWVQVVPNIDNSASNAVTIGFASIGNIYKVYALGRSATFTGAVDEDLTIDLATAEPVSVNIQYREV